MQYCRKLCIAVLVLFISLFVIPAGQCQERPMSVCSLSKEGCPTVTKDGKTTVSYAYPSGDPDNSVLLLEKTAPQEIIVDRTFTYTLTVSNLTPCAIEDLRIIETLPENFVMRETSPEYESMQNSRVVWEMASLAAEETTQIAITGKVTEPGNIPYCTKVTYNPLLCVISEVVQPELTMNVTAPLERSLCRALPVTILVANDGTGTIRNVKVNAILPDGLTSEEGLEALHFKADTLEAGESVSFSTEMMADRPGEYTLKVNATAADNLEADAKMETFIWKPVLSLDASGDDEIYLGRQAEIFFRLQNVGSGPANDIKVSAEMPDALEFISASHDGVLHKGEVRWDLESLTVDEFKTLSVRMGSREIGSPMMRATAIGECCDQVAVVKRIEVKGIPGILLGMIDVSDPIEVGQEEVYIITIVNQGSAPGTNITIEAEFEDNFEFVSTSGPTESTVKGRKIVFDPLELINPKQEVSWMVTLKAVKPGDVRFHMTMKSDELSRAVMETEATTIY